VRLATRIFFSFLLVSAVCFYYPMSHFVRDLRTFFLESVEDPLADQANLLAAVVGAHMETNRFDPQELDQIFQQTYSRSLPARIYGFPKTRVDMRVYITDVSGRVIFDSWDPKNIGADYSHWRDVSMTLRGEYGTRTSRCDPSDPASTVLYVGAPILVNGKIAGVLTVAKPTTNINAFIRLEKPTILHRWYLATFLAIVLSFAVSLWLTLPIKRLTRYANDVRDGKRVALPPVGRSELRDMALALENMRDALEGKKYVEQYIHTFTHEIKSPLSAIRAAAELLDEEMPREKRERFLSNIRTEAGRIQDLVDRMLELSELESQRDLRNVAAISLQSLIQTVLESMEPMFARKALRVECCLDENIRIPGDPFLLHRAISNIVQNAVDFSPAGGSITITSHSDGKEVTLTIDDQGTGIPGNYRERVFDRFFSLQRPDTGKKSTGLGLNFVKEVATLHKGDIRLENLPDKGLRAVLSLPV
jgi:two-component system, OmpR family, sensor histidine kinase CreC